MRLRKRQKVARRRGLVAELLEDRRLLALGPVAGPTLLLADLAESQQLAGGEAIAVASTRRAKATSTAPLDASTGDAIREAIKVVAPAACFVLREGEIRLLATGPGPDELLVRGPHNVNAADTTNTDQIQPGGSAGLSLTGAGYTVGVWDAGGIRGTHQEFGGRVTQVDAGSTHYHATHVAGTIGAEGVVSNAQGMATAVSLRSYDWNNDTSELNNDAALIQVSNHSYGNITGWYVGAASDWGFSTSSGSVDVWYDDRYLFSTEDHDFGKYSTATRTLDQVLHDRAHLLSVWSAGNDRNNFFSNASTDNNYVAYFSGDPGGIGFNTPGWYLVGESGVTSAPPQDGNGGSGYDTLSVDQTAKNTLVVGAVSDVTADPYSPSQIVTTSFSSYGPTDDGRIKPDVVGNGSSLYSTMDTSDTAYDSLSGTSMSSPNVAGTAILLVEHFEDHYSRLPRSATTKGLLIHTAADTGRTGPDYRFGWGLVDAAAAAQFVTDAAGNLTGTRYLDERSYVGTEQTISVTSDGTQPLKATIVWTDPEGAAHSASTLDEATPALVNDLDLWVTGPAGTFYPWTLDGTNPSLLAVRTQANHVDNVEQVVIDAPAAGTYTIHIGDTGGVASQDYSLFVTGASESTVAGIDLAGTSFEVSPKDLRDAAGSIAASFAVRNLGDTAANATFDLKFYLSDDAAIDPALDTLLNLSASDPNYDAAEPSAYHVTGGLASLATLSATITLETPASDPSGTDNDYYIGVFVDADGEIAEADETNNHSRGLTYDMDRVGYSLRAEIRGSKWNDYDGNGVWDAGEPALADWEIYLDVNRNGQHDPGEPLQVTDSSGSYTFADLEPGTYIVAEEQQADWEQTYPGASGKRTVVSPAVAISSLSPVQETLDDVASWEADAASHDELVDAEGDFDAHPTEREIWGTPRSLSLDEIARLTGSLVGDSPSAGGAGRAAGPDDEPPPAPLNFVSVDQTPEGDMPREVAYTTDGLHVLVVNRDTDNLIVYDAVTRNLVADITVGDFPVHVAVTPDGQYALVANLGDDTVSVVDLSDWTAAAHVPVSGDQPFRVEVTSDSQYAVVGIDGGTGGVSSFSVISLSTLAEVRNFVSAPQGVTGSFGNTESGASGLLYTTFALLPDDITILLPDRGNSRVKFYNLTTGTETDTVPTAASPWGVDVSPDGTFAVVAHTNGPTITKIDLATRAVAGTFATSSNAYGFPIRVTPDNNFAIVAIFNAINFVDLVTGDTTNIPTGAVGDIEISYDGQYAFISNFNSRVIDIASQSEVAVLSLAPSAEVAVSPAALKAVALNNHFGEDLHFYDISGASSVVEGRMLSGQDPEGDGTRTLAMSPDGGTLIAGNNISDNIAIIDVDTQTVRAYVNTGDRVQGVAVTPDGTHAVVANTEQNTVSIIDLSTDSLVATLPVSTRPVQIEISPDSRSAYVSTVADTDSIYFLNLDGANSSVVTSITTGQMGSSFAYAYTMLSGIALSPDGSLLAVAASFDDQIVLIDTATRNEVTRVSVGDFPIKIAFSPDGTKAYTLNTSGDSVSVVEIDGAASSLVATVAGIDTPSTINIDAAGEYVYVGSYGTTSPGVYVIDATTNSTIGFVSSDGPRDAYLSSDSILYTIANDFGAGEISRISAAGAESTLIDSTSLTSSPSALAFSESHSQAIVAQPVPDGVDFVSFALWPGTHQVTVAGGQVAESVNFGNVSEGVRVTESGGGTLVVEGGATDSYELALRTAPSGPVEITVTADAQSEVSVDGSTFADSLVFTRADTTPQTITVQAKQDLLVEGNHSATITHAITGAVVDPNYPTSLPISPITVDILDDDGTQLTIEDASASEGAGLLFTLRLEGTVQSPFTVNVSFTDGSATGGAPPLVTPEDYDNTPIALNFNGAAGETRQFTVNTLADGVPDGDEIFTVHLSATNASVDASDTATGLIISLPNASIRGSKWNDLDGDGRRDPFEPGLAGVTIYLDANDNGQLDDGELTTITWADDLDTTEVDETGTYEFVDLVPGDHIVAEVVPTGYTQTYPGNFTGGTNTTTFANMIMDDDGGVGGLDGARAVAVSPDGKHLYVASVSEAAVAVFSRDAATGRATFVQVLRDGVAGVDGLSNVESIAVSPDGLHVFAAANLDDSLVVFQRDQVTGQLTPFQTFKDGIGGVDGLNGSNFVALSLDGAHVYVAADQDDAVTVFSRDGTTGQLTVVEFLQDGINAVDGLNGASSLVVAPDGAHVYVTGESDNALSVFSRDAGTGQLTFVTLYQDGVDGIDGLDRAISVTISPDNQHVYASGYTDNGLAVFSRDTSTGELGLVEVLKDGVAGVDGLRWTFSLAVSPDGNHVYTAAAADNAVSVFSRNATTGALAFVEAWFDGVNGVDGLRGAKSIVVSPEGAHVYAAGETDDALVGFSRNPATGSLVLEEILQDSQGGVDGLNGARAVVASTDGNHVYVAGWLESAVAVFRRDYATGGLLFVEVHKDGEGGVDGLRWPYDMALSPDGAHLYAAGAGEGAVALFRRDLATGELTFVSAIYEGLEFSSNPQSLAVSPDGQHVYLAAYGRDRLLVYSRNQATGNLTLVETLLDDVSGVDGLKNPNSVRLSPDGGFVYVTSAGDHSVAVFRRNLSTGGLTFVQVLKQGVGGVNGLSNVRQLRLSPDGKNVYTSAWSNYVSVFDRDSTTGELTFVEWFRDGSGGVDGLLSAMSVDISPDGSQLFVTGYNDNAVAIFDRDLGTGRLTFRNVLRDGQNGVEGLTRPIGVAAAPDDRHVYVTGEASDTLVTLSRDLGTFSPQPYRFTTSPGELVVAAFANQDAQAPTVESVVLGDGTASRSALREIVVTFDSLVTIDEDALAVNKRGGGGAVNANVALSQSGGKTVATLTFVGAYVDATGSLVEGNYDLTVYSTKVRDLSGNPFDGDPGNGSAADDLIFGDEAIDYFFRLYGDGDGDRDVDFLDFFGFRAASGTTSGSGDYDPNYDFDQDGDVDFLDFFQFRDRFGTSMGFS